MNENLHIQSCSMMHDYSGFIPSGGAELNHKEKCVHATDTEILEAFMNTNKSGAFGRLPGPKDYETINNDPYSKNAWYAFYAGWRSCEQDDCQGRSGAFERYADENNFPKALKKVFENRRTKEQFRSSWTRSAQQAFELGWNSRVKMICHSL